MMLAGLHCGTVHVVALEGDLAVRHTVHSQLELLPDGQSSQLLDHIAVI